MGFPGGIVVKNLPVMPETCRKCRFDPWVRKVPWRRVWPPTPVFLPGNPHGQRCLVGYSPWGCKESDVTKHSTAQPVPLVLKRVNIIGVFHILSDQKTHSIWFCPLLVLRRLMKR